MPVKILFLITDLNLGGTEKILFETATRLDKNRFIPVVFGLKGWGLYAEKTANAGIEVHTMDIYRLGYFLSPLLWVYSVIKISKYVKNMEVSLIHTFLFQANITGRIISYMCGKIPVISSIRVMEEQKKWQLLIERIMSGMSGVFTANSLALKSFLVKKKVCSAAKIEVIHNGIDITALPAPDRNWLITKFGFRNDDYIFVTAGRLHKQKGVRFLIESTALLVIKYKNIKCLIIGDGPEKEFLINTTKMLLPDNHAVVFAGRQEPEETLKIISSADVFVLASEWEGTPNVILEAMALGKPIISTNVGGTAEIIEEGIDGLFVQPRDSKALSTAMEKTIQDKDFALRMGLKAKDKITRNFNIVDMVNKTEKLYEKVISLKNSSK